MSTLNKLYAMLLIALLLVAFWLRFEDLDAMPPGISTDESFNVVDSFILAHTGDLPPYEDLNRPEHLHRIILAMGATFGSRVWVFRLVNVFGGVIAVALTDWATRQCLYDQPRAVRRAAGLAAAAALTVAMGHIVLARSLYRGLWQPVVMLLMVGFLMRGLSDRAYSNGMYGHTPRRRWRDFILSGIALGLAWHTYTAALIVPAVLPGVALILLIFRFRQWRVWLPGLVALGIAFAVVVAPIAYMLLTDRDRVLTRANDVSAPLTRDNAQDRFMRVWDQITTRGDIISQYNADYAPVVPHAFLRLFEWGLVLLLVRLRHPSSALIAGLVMISTVPVVLAGEIPHGLRISGAFAAFPLVIGVGLGGSLALVGAGLRRIRRIPAAAHPALALITTGIILSITAISARDVRADYRAWWDNADHPWAVYGQVLPHGDWFFRTDHRAFAEYLTGLDGPVLVPVEAINAPTMRAWLLARYPRVITWLNTPPGFVSDAPVLLPWELELGGLRRESVQLAYLSGDTIMLMPGFGDLPDGGEPVYGPDGNEIARVFPSDDLQLDSFASWRPETPQEQLVVFDYAVAVGGWRGIFDGGEVEVNFLPLKNGIDHYYSAFVQVQTQDYRRIAGDEKQIYRWLYPPPLWSIGDGIPVIFHLDVPSDLPPGAYRMVIGLYRGEYMHLRVPVTQSVAEVVDNMTTFGWYRVPQLEVPTLDPVVVAYDAELGRELWDGRQFALRGGRAEIVEPGKVRLILTWQALSWGMFQEMPALDATIFVHVLDTSGKFVTQDDSRPHGGQYPTFIWTPDEFVETEHVLEIGSADPSDLRLVAGMYTFVGEGTTRLPVIQNGVQSAGQIVNLGDLAALMGE